MIRRYLMRRASVAFAARAMSWYPPFLGAGVSARALDEYTIEVTMRLRWYNRNIVGTHFGGSLYAMCDPWFMLLLMRHLGGGYVVWDKAATVRFKRPGRGTVRARFHIPPTQVDDIRARADAEPKLEPQFVTQVLAGDGTVVADVEKLLYVRRREPAAGKAA
ncbi:MAG: YiiD C-terminal domain-containing protein [Gemmatimonadaceae bacterium]|nr:YiiD C-terminal domain-containing protein [Gemmatimonadaceae bacterium]